MGQAQARLTLFLLKPPRGLSKSKGNRRILRNGVVTLKVAVSHPEMDAVTPVQNGIVIRVGSLGGILDRCIRVGPLGGILDARIGDSDVSAKSLSQSNYALGLLSFVLLTPKDKSTLHNYHDLVNQFVVESFSLVERKSVQNGLSLASVQPVNQGMVSKLTLMKLEVFLLLFLPSEESTWNTLFFSQVKSFEKQLLLIVKFVCPFHQSLKSL